jgi:hypothetical protein
MRRIRDPYHGFERRAPRSDGSIRGGYVYDPNEDLTGAKNSYAKQLLDEVNKERTRKQASRDAVVLSPEDTEALIITLTKVSGQERAGFLCTLWDIQSLLEVAR